jgi:Isochorismatase family
MSVSLGAPGLRRHWFVASFTIVCFATPVALLFSQFYRPTTVDFKEPIQWVYTWIWALLDLFPHPATVGALASFFQPWLRFERAHTAVALASRQRGVTQIFLTGIASSSGVESTARSAYDYGYNVVLVVDAMTDRDPDAHRHSVEKIFPRLGQTDTTDNVLKVMHG